MAALEEFPKVKRKKIAYEVGYSSYALQRYILVFYLTGRWRYPKTIDCVRCTHFGNNYNNDQGIIFPFVDKSSTPARRKTMDF